MSLLFVMIFPEDYRVVGVIVATIITSLGIVYTVEPHVVFKYVFKTSARAFYLRNYAYTGLFALCLVAMTALMQSGGSALTSALQNGVIAVGLAVSALSVVFLVDKAFRREAKSMWGKMVEGVRKVMNGVNGLMVGGGCDEGMDCVYS